MYSFGFRVAKASDGKSHGHATIILRPRNAYELLGLRRPHAPNLGKT